VQIIVIEVYARPKPIYEVNCVYSDSYAIRMSLGLLIGQIKRNRVFRSSRKLNHGTSVEGVAEM
jgi:hypothetical protein